MNYRIRIPVILALIVSFCILTAFALNGCLDAAESGVYAFVIEHISPALTNIAIIITNMGSFGAVAAVAGLLLVLPKTRIKLGVPVAFNAGLAAGLNIILKQIIARERPEILRLTYETGYGFPSGHAMNNAALYTLIIQIVFRLTKRRKIRIPVLIGGSVITLLIGVSRVYLGVHYAGDVLAGWIMGVAAALVVDVLWRFFQVPKKLN